MFLTKEQVDEYDIAQCEAAIKALDAKWGIDKRPMSKLVMDNLDNITNTLLYLEDRIDYIKLCERTAQALATRWADHESG